MSSSLLSRMTARVPFKLAAGSGGGYLIVLIISPVITRLYSPEEFGQFSIFGSLVAITSIFMTCSLEIGILSARRVSHAFRFVMLATGVAVTASVLLLLALLGAVALGVGLTLPLWAMVCAIISCLTASLTSIGINWSIRRERPEIAAWSVFSSLSARSLLQMLFGWMSGGLSGLLIGEVLGRAVALGLSNVRATVRPLTRPRATLAMMRRNFRLMQPYIVHMTPSSAIDTALFWLPAPLFALLFDPFAGGLIALVQRFSSVPITVLNQSLGHYFQHRYGLSSPEGGGSFVLLLLQFAFLIALGTLIVVLLLFWKGADISRIVLGAQWQEAYKGALSLAPLYALQMMSLLTNRILIVRMRMRVKLLSSLAQLVLLVTIALASKAIGLSWNVALLAIASALATVHLATISFAFVLIRSSSPQQ